VLEKDGRDIIEKLALKYCFSTVDRIKHSDMFSEEVVSLSMKGNSENQPDLIENIITFKLANHSIEDFYNQINKTRRLSNYSFGCPFKIEVTWTIDIPSGFKVDNKLTNKTFKKVDSISAYMIYKQLDNTLLIHTTLDFPTFSLSSKQHKKLIGLLADVRNELEEDIILSPLN